MKKKKDVISKYFVPESSLGGRKVRAKDDKTDHEEDDVDDEEEEGIFEVEKIVRKKILPSVSYLVL